MEILIFIAIWLSLPLKFWGRGGPSCACLPVLPILAPGVAGHYRGANIFFSGSVSIGLAGLGLQGRLSSVAATLLGAPWRSCSPWYSPLWPSQVPLVQEHTSVNCHWIAILFWVSWVFIVRIPMKQAHGIIFKYHPHVIDFWYHYNMTWIHSQSA